MNAEVVTFWSAVALHSHKSQWLIHFRQFKSGQVLALLATDVEVWIFPHLIS